MAIGVFKKIVRCWGTLLCRSDNSVLRARLKSPGLAAKICICWAILPAQNMILTPVLRNLRREYCEFKVSLGYNCRFQHVWTIYWDHVSQQIHKKVLSMYRSKLNSPSQGGAVIWVFISSTCVLESKLLRWGFRRWFGPEDGALLILMRNGLLRKVLCS